MYDKYCKKSILNYAKKLRLKSLRDSCEFEDSKNLYKGKGNFGQVLEKYYFGYEINSDSQADFKEVNLELKTSPLKRLNNGTIKSKERLVLNIINYMDIVNEDFYNSSFYKKNENLLLVFYLHEQAKHFLDYIIKLVDIWSFSENDLNIIYQDWIKIKNKIIEGNAHELSEGDTFYLGAATKGSKGGNLREQPFSNQLAKQRAFSFKQGYVNHIIASISLSEKIQYGQIIKSKTNETLEEIVENKFKYHYLKSVDEILASLDIDINKKAKSFYANLTNIILGIKTDEKIEEFTKADVIVKTVRLKTNGTPKEDISFPTFKYKEIVNQTWEESDFKEKLEKKFFFIFYQYNGSNELILKKVKFWNMPYSDLLEVKDMWEETVKRIKQGKADSLPKKSEHRIAHVRPHARNKQDTYETPYGTYEVKKCFWLNAKYIKDIFKGII